MSERDALAVLVRVELSAVLVRLRDAERRLRADADATVASPDDADSRAALARLEGFASGLGLAASWADALLVRLPELSRIARLTDGADR
jgi:hypothetical protein